MVREHRGEYPSGWQACQSIAPKVGVHPVTLHEWVKRADTDVGKRPGLTTDERDRLKQLEKENRELKRANEILKSAAAFFGAELDGRRPR
jgi:transposase